jgi:hypothetical protein
MRYASIDYVMRLEHSRGYMLIKTAIEKNGEEKLYQKWLSDMARYEMSFEDYKKACTPYRKSTEKEKEEIISKFGGA